MKKTFLIALLCIISTCFSQEDKNPFLGSWIESNNPQNVITIYNDTITIHQAVIGHDAKNSTNQKKAYFDKEYSYIINDNAIIGTLVKSTYRIEGDKPYEKKIRNQQLHLHIKNQKLILKTKSGQLIEFIKKQQA